MHSHGIDAIKLPTLVKFTNKVIYTRKIYRYSCLVLSLCCRVKPNTITKVQLQLLNVITLGTIETILIMQIIKESKSTEAGVTFDNSFFDNSFVFLRQLKNRSFLQYIRKWKLELIEVKCCPVLLRLIISSTFSLHCTD